MLGEYYTIQLTVVTYHSILKFCKVFSRVLNSHRSLVFNFQSPILPCFILKPFLTSSVESTFLIVRWRGGFVNVSQCRHTKNMIFLSLWFQGVKEGKNYLLTDSGEWWGFNPTYCRSFWSSAKCRRKKEAAQEHISSSITSLSALCWWVLMQLVREECERDGYGLCHLRLKALILTRKE